MIHGSLSLVVTRRALGLRQGSDNLTDYGCFAELKRALEGLVTYPNMGLDQQRKIPSFQVSSRGEHVKSFGFWISTRTVVVISLEASSRAR